MILDKNLQEIESLVENLNEPKYRAKQLLSAATLLRELPEISTIPNSLKEKLQDEWFSFSVATEQRSKDGTVKVALKLADGAIVESVLLPYSFGNTVCVSTQVGCRMGCKFCASTIGGLKRNLSAGEILLQVLFFNKILGGNSKERKVTNVVLMGCGEPLDNYDSVTKFLRLVTSKNGLNISMRNISLSTCGIVPKIRQLADDGFSVTLTISLHAPNDALRKTIMPIANKFSISEILAACAYYFEKTGRRICFEYSLISGVNDSGACIAELCALLRGKPCVVNLIPLNSVKEKNLLGSTRKHAYAIAERLKSGGVNATVRRTMGADIDGACGQLRNKLTGEQ